MKRAGRGARVAFLPFVLGLGVLSTVVLVAALDFGGITYSIAVVVLSLAGLVLAISALVAWRAGRWVRRLVAIGQSEGKTVWPVRAQIDGPSRVRLGVLEADETGLTVTLEMGKIRATWPTLLALETEDGGPLRSEGIVVKGNGAARFDFEILQENAVLRASRDVFAESVDTLRRLQTNANAA